MSELQNQNRKPSPESGAAAREETALLLARIRTRSGEGQGSSFDSSDAFAVLLEQYAPLIASLVSRYAAFLPDGTPEDWFELEEESRIALYHAALTFEEGKHSTFGLYAKICIRNRLISYLRRYERHRLAQDSAAAEHTQIPADPEEFVISDVSFREKLDRAVTTMTPYERAVFDCYLAGASYREIASALSSDKKTITEKSVENAVYRIRKKLRLSLDMPE